MAIEFQNDPYFDDYDVAGSDGLTPREKYYRVLFRPAVAVQARTYTITINSPGPSVSFW